MRIPFRKTESEKVQANLAAARAHLAEMDAGRAAAQADSAAFATWSARRNEASLEVSRLSGLLETTDNEAAEAARAAAVAETKGKLDAARKHEVDLRNRVMVDAPRLMGELLTIFRDCARQSLIAKELNAALPEGEVPVPTSDIAARDTALLKRVDLKTEELTLWVRRDNGRLIGDQKIVEMNEDGTGRFVANGERVDCLKRTYRSQTFHPSVIGDFPGDFFSRLRLPNPYGPGLIFDGEFATPEAVAAMDVELKGPPKAPRRSIETELTPTGVWPPPGVPSEANRNAAQ